MRDIILSNQERKYRNAKASGWLKTFDSLEKSEVKQANPRPNWKGLQQNTKCDKDILWIQVLHFWGWKNIKAHRRVDIENGPIYGICLTNRSILHRSHERDMTNVTKSQETQFSSVIPSLWASSVKFRSDNTREGTAFLWPFTVMSFFFFFNLGFNWPKPNVKFYRMKRLVRSNDRKNIINIPVNISGKHCGGESKDFRKSSQLEGSSNGCFYKNRASFFILSFRPY